MEDLSKSLSELDAMADELLSKSVSKGEDEDVKPEEISDEFEKDEKPAKKKADKKPKDEDVEDDKDLDDDEEDDEEFDDEDDEDEDDGDDEEDDDTDDEEDEDDDDDEDVKKSEPSVPSDAEEDEIRSKANAELNKSDDDEDDFEDDDDEEETVEKSMRDRFEQDPLIRSQMQNSEFMSAVVDVMAKSLADVQYDLTVKSRDDNNATAVLAKSLKAVVAHNQALQLENDKLSRRLNRLEKSISHGFDRIIDSLEDMSTQPATMRKSVASINVHDRDFDRSLNGVRTVGGFESLSKSQVLNVLNTELYAGNALVSASDIISYESGAPLRDELKNLVASKCGNN